MRPLQLIDLPEDPKARGWTFGARRKEAIKAFTADWLQSLRDAGVGDPRAYLTGLVARSRYKAAILDCAPELLSEVNGIADGADIDRDLLFAAQLMDEEWAYRGAVSPERPWADKCSSLAVKVAAGHTLIGQNMDLGGYTDGHQVVLRLAGNGEEPGCLVFSVGGMIGLMGVNACKVAVCVNALPQLPAVREGVPVAFVIRKLLQARSAEQAVHRLREIPHATAQHYLIADPTQIRSFEVAPDRALEYRAPEPSTVIHTNHPLVAQPSTPASEQHQANSLARLRSLSDRLLSRAVSLEIVQAALSSADDPRHPVCRLGGDEAGGASSLAAFTTGSMISRLDRDTADVSSWLSPGPPSRHGYHQLSLTSGAA